MAPPSRSPAPGSLDALLHDHLSDTETQLRRYLKRRLREHQDIDDFVQDVHVRILALSENDRAEVREPWGFVRRIASNLMIDRFRRGAVRNAGAHVTLDAAFDHIDDQAFDGERSMIGKDRLLRADRILAELDENTRRALLAVRLEGKSHREVAAEMRIPEKQVSRLMERALLALARGMAEE